MDGTRISCESTIRSRSEHDFVHAHICAGCVCISATRDFSPREKRTALMLAAVAGDRYYHRLRGPLVPIGPSLLRAQAASTWTCDFAFHRDLSKGPLPDDRSIPMYARMYRNIVSFKSHDVYYIIGYLSQLMEKMAPLHALSYFKLV